MIGFNMIKNDKDFKLKFKSYLRSNKFSKKIKLIDSIFL